MWVSKRYASRTSDDDRVVERLRATLPVVPETDLWRGEAKLLAAVRRCRDARTELSKEQRSMRFAFSKKAFALTAAGVLALGAAGAVGASGGVSDAAGNVGDVLAALHVTDRTPDVADEHIDAIEQPNGEPGAQDGEQANDNAAEGADNADDGINNSNASDNGLDHAADNAFEGAGNAEGEHGLGALPHQADEHADDAGANAADIEPGVSDNANVPPDVDLPDQALEPLARD
jgi:hypothetical protein